LRGVREADTLYFSEEAVAKAGEPKELFVVPGKTHVDLYDDTEGTLPKLVGFFGSTLWGGSEDATEAF